MVKITRLSIVLGLFIVSFSIAKAGEADSSKSLPNTPLHSFEGGSGVFLTNLAYLAKPPKEGEILGPPSILTSMVLIDGINRYAYARRVQSKVMTSLTNFLTNSSQNRQFRARNRKAAKHKCLTANELKNWAR